MDANRERHNNSDGGGEESLYFETELLDPPEASPHALEPTPQLASNLFSFWLSVPETTRLVKSLIEDAKAGNPVPVLGMVNTSNASCSSPRNGGSLLPSMTAPPLSPRSTSGGGSPRTSAKQRPAATTPSSCSSPLKFGTEPFVLEVIPQFYSQNRQPPPKEIKEQCLLLIDQYFGNNIDGMKLDGKHSLSSGWWITI